MSGVRRLDIRASTPVTRRPPGATDMMDACPRPRNAAGSRPGIRLAAVRSA